MNISWGVPTIKVTKIGGGSPIVFPTPVDGSTQLSTEKGDKMEALIEGGEAEAIKYKRGKYTLEFQIRLGSNDGVKREFPVDGLDGVVDGEYALELSAEDEGAPGFKFAKSVCSYEDSYTSEDGIIRTYQFESLKADKTTPQLEWVWPDEVSATYEAVSSPSGNPSTKGYYEKVGNSYVASTDTTVDSSKTYYTKKA